MKIPDFAASLLALLYPRRKKRQMAEWYGRASTECLFGNHTRAIEMVNEMFGHDAALKGDGYLQLVLGVSYYRLGRMEDALKTLETGASLVRSHPPTQTVMRQFVKRGLETYADLLKVQGEDAKVLDILSHVEESYGDTPPLGEYGLDERKKAG